jgi:hypothetical protein
MKIVKKASHSLAVIIRCWCISFMKARIFLRPPARRVNHFRDEILEACGGNTMMGLSTLGFALEACGGNTMMGLSTLGFAFRRGLALRHYRTNAGNAGRYEITGVPQAATLQC